MGGSAMGALPNFHTDIQAPFGASREFGVRMHATLIPSTTQSGTTVETGCAFMMGKLGSAPHPQHQYPEHHHKHPQHQLWCRSLLLWLPGSVHGCTAGALQLGRQLQFAPRLWRTVVLLDRWDTGHAE